MDEEENVLGKSRVSNHLPLLSLSGLFWCVCVQGSITKQKGIVELSPSQLQINVLHDLCARSSSLLQTNGS